MLTKAFDKFYRKNSPKCPKCKKSLYKSLEKPKRPLAIKKNPYAFCRNELCPLYKIDQVNNKDAVVENIKNEIKKK
jgi:hypothetical protein